MKRFLLCVTLFLAGLRLLAQGTESLPLFCTEPGTHLYYERVKAGNGKLIQTTDMDIERIEETADGSVVHYSVVLRKNGKREMHGGRVSLTTLVDAANNTHMDFASSVKSFVQGMFPKSNIKASGTSAILPVDMKPGDSLPDVHAKVEVSIISLTVDITGRQVLRKEQITTPAGTFDCIVTRDHKVENVPLHYKDNWVENWYAPGIGYVQHVTYDENMQTLSVEQLVRIDLFTPGS